MTASAQMRRADKAITDPDELHRILDEAQVIRLGLVDEGRPYVVPLNFARDGDEIWLHCAAEGRKLRCLRADPNVCIEADRLIQVTSGPSACGAWTSHYESVIGFGAAEVVTDDDEQAAGPAGDHGQVLGQARLGVRRGDDGKDGGRPRQTRLAHRQTLAGQGLSTGAD